MGQPTNAKKQRACEAHSTYLKIIYHFGNKVILMKQLFEYAQALGLAKSYPQFHAHVQELVDADVLHQEPFEALGKTTQLHMLKMRKYGLRFIEGKADSTGVGAVPKSNSNERILLAIFKNVYILDKIIPALQKKNTPVSYESINELLEAHRSNLLFNKNKGLDYMQTWDSDFMSNYFDIPAVQGDVAKLELLNAKKKAGLLKGAKASEGKGVGGRMASNEPIANIEADFELAEEKPKQNKKLKKMNEYNMDSMMNAYSYIAQMKEINGVFNITALMFDISNGQDVYKLSTQIASIYHMFFRYLKPDMPFLLKVGVIALDGESELNMKKEASKTVKDRITKEPKGALLETTFNNWSISYAEQEKIKVVFSNYDITNRYLDGIKHANLMRK